MTLTYWYGYCTCWYLKLVMLLFGIKQEKSIKEDLELIIIKETVSPECNTKFIQGISAVFSCPKCSAVSSI